MKGNQMSKVISNIVTAARASRNESGEANIGSKDIAKIIRVRLRAEFPGVKFTVRSDYSSLRISWTDGPRTPAVDEIVQQYSFGGFDGMIDMTYSSRNWLLPDGSMEPAASTGTEGNKGTVPGFATDCPQPGAVLCNSGLKYVFTSRDQSDEERAKDREAVCKYYGIEDDTSKAPCRVYCENMGDYLDRVIWRYYREHNMA